MELNFRKLIEISKAKSKGEREFRERGEGEACARALGQEEM